jgi:hypothetical protein
MSLKWPRHQRGDGRGFDEMRRKHHFPSAGSAGCSPVRLPRPAGGGILPQPVGKGKRARRAPCIEVAPAEANDGVARLEHGEPDPFAGRRLAESEVGSAGRRACRHADGSSAETSDGAGRGMSVSVGHLGYCSCIILFYRNPSRSINMLL